MKKQVQQVSKVSVKVLLPEHWTAVPRIEHTSFYTVGSMFVPCVTPLLLKESCKILELEADKLVLALINCERISDNTLYPIITFLE